MDIEDPRPGACRRIQERYAQGSDSRGCFHWWNETSLRSLSCCAVTSSHSLLCTPMGSWNLSLHEDEWQLTLMDLYFRLSGLGLWESIVRTLLSANELS